MGKALVDVLLFFLDNRSPRIASLAHLMWVDSSIASATGYDQEKIEAALEKLKSKRLIILSAVAVQPWKGIRRCELAAVKYFRLCLEQAKGRTSTTEHYAAHCEIEK